MIAAGINETLLHNTNGLRCISGYIQERFARVVQAIQNPDSSLYLKGVNQVVKAGRIIRIGRLSAEAVGLMYGSNCLFLSDKLPFNME